jgi:hypothetical protein
MMEISIRKIKDSLAHLSAELRTLKANSHIQIRSNNFTGTEKFYRKGYENNAYKPYYKNNYISRENYGCGSDNVNARNSYQGKNNLNYGNKFENNSFYRQRSHKFNGNFNYNKYYEGGRPQNKFAWNNYSKCNLNHAQTNWTRPSNEVLTNKFSNNEQFNRNLKAFKSCNDRIHRVRARYAIINRVNNTSHCISEPIEDIPSNKISTFNSVKTFNVRKNEICQNKLTERPKIQCAHIPQGKSLSNKAIQVTQIEKLNNEEQISAKITELQEVIKQKSAVVEEQEQMLTIYKLRTRHLEEQMKDEQNEHRDEIIKRNKEYETLLYNTKKNYNKLKFKNKDTDTVELEMVENSSIPRYWPTPIAPWNL